MTSLTTTLKRELALLLAPLGDLLDATRFRGFIEAAVDPAAADYAPSTRELADAIDDLVNSLSAEPPSDDDLADAAFAVLEKLVELVPAARAQFEGAPEIDADRAAELGALLLRRLLDHLVYEYVIVHHRRVFAVFHLLGVVETVEAETGHQVEVVQWPRLARLLYDPGENFHEVYAWRYGFDGNELLSRLELVLRVLALPGGIYRQPDSVRELLGRYSWDDQEIRMPVLSRSAGDDYAEIALNVCPVPATADHRPGLLLYPYVTGAVTLDQDLSENWAFELKGNADLGSGLGVELRPPAELIVRSDLLNGVPVGADAHLELGVTRRVPGGGLTLVFGSESGSHLGFMGLGFKVYLGVEGGAYVGSGELWVDGFTLVVDAGEGDGFIQKILSGVRLESVSDLVIGISNTDGFYFKGSSALSVTIPLHKQLGPIYLDSVLVGLGFGEEIRIILGVSFGVELGPVTGSVKRIGLQVPFTIREDGDGNWGPVNVEGIEFLPPLGVGVGIDTGGVVSGGGYLECDNENKRYAGILQLRIGDIGVTGVGLITTRMPDGSQNFSMVVVVSVLISPPIQISFGFTISGFGGGLGINRSINVEALRAGLRNHTADSILFPEDPIRNAPKIISDMRAVFPPVAGRFMVGPMVRIGWGSPNIITGDIGIFIEIPSPVRIVLLGQIAAILPDPEDVVVEIHIDVLGVLDFAKKSLAIDAVIYDSRILEFTLTGDAALRLLWGDEPQFAMSLGGFHPSFTPPPNFPSLRRLTLSLSSGGKLSISCKSYKALTSNSLQFGSRLELYAKSGGVKVTGHLGFDTLFYFSPFSFVATISGGVHARYRGHSLCGIRLSMKLSGPTPWRAKGKATFEIYVWEVSFRFDRKWGRSPPPALPSIPAEDVLFQLTEALDRNETWGGVLPPTTALAESLRSQEGADTPDRILVHPAGSLEIRQKVVPLGIELEKFGNAEVEGGSHFDIDQVTVAGQALEVDPVRDYFAMGQFEALSQSEQLSRPSFELMRAGLAARSRDVDYGTEDKRNGLQLSYESIVLREDRTSEPPKPGVIPWWIARRQVRGAALRKGAMVRSGRLKYGSPSRKPKVGVVEGGYTFASSADLAAHDLADGYAWSQGRLTRTEADQALSRYLDDHPEQEGELQVVPSHEARETP